MLNQSLEHIKKAIEELYAVNLNSRDTLKEEREAARDLLTQASRKISMIQRAVESPTLAVRSSLLVKASEGSSPSTPGPWRSNRDLGEEGKYQIGDGPYTPKVGDEVDYYDTVGDKRYGKVLSLTPTQIVILDLNTNQKVTQEIYYCVSRPYPKRRRG